MGVKRIPAWQLAAVEAERKEAERLDSEFPSPDQVVAADDSDLSEPEDDPTNDEPGRKQAGSSSGGSRRGSIADEPSDDDIEAQGLSSADDAEPGIQGDDETDQDKELMDMARRFIQDGTVKGAPREKKVSFLVSKGVDRSKAEDLVDELDPAVESVPSKADFVASFNASNQTAASPAPIITYPEFLVHAQQPTPLLTTSRVANIITGTVTAMAGIYGLSQFIVSPMTEALAVARHDLHSTALNKLQELNEKLSGKVSGQPKTKSEAVTDSIERLADEMDEQDRSLFQRSVGVQTSPSLTREQSSAELKTEEEKPNIGTQQHTRLKSILDNLNELNTANTLDAEVEGQLGSSVTSLKWHFYELTHTRPTFQSYSYMFGAPPKADGKNGDPLQAMKDEIRGMKGSLLSPRAFPRKGPSATVH